METKYVRVMADYCADGLWDEDGSMIELSDPDLNLPDDLIERINAWQLWFTKDCQDYIEESKRSTVFDRKAFSSEGLKIARSIKVHLGEDWTVVYFDDKKYYDTIVERSVYEYEV